MEISLLLTLPKSSTGLGFLRSTTTEYGTDGASSPRRKIARLDADSDIASRVKSKTLKKPIQLQVQTDDDAPKIVQGVLDRERLTQTKLLDRCMQAVLSPTKEHDFSETYEKIYSTCRSIVTIHGAGAALYNIFRSKLLASVTELTNILIDAEDEPVAWIGELAKYCKWFEAQISLLKSLLTYLDQVYVVNSGGTVSSIQDEANSLFAERIFGNLQIIARLRKSITTWLDWEREQSRPHKQREKILNLIKYLALHNHYNAFEQHYVDITQKYYSKESEKHSHGEPQDFFELVQDKIKEEITRAEGTLPVSSWGIIRQVTETSLLDNRVEWLSRTYFPKLMDAKDLKILGEMYALFTRVDGQAHLEKAFHDYMRQNARIIVEDSARDEEMVQCLLELKALADQTIDTSFRQPSPPQPAPSRGSSSASATETQRDQRFVYALDNAFSYGFRARRSKPAEMIAKHLHTLLRTGQGALSAAEYQASLDAALALYRYSDDKDVFRTFYHRLLAKRLLVGKSASDDIEASMLKQLKEKYDPEFGMGEDMFKDLTLSKELMKDYLARKAKGSAAHKLNVVVLQRSAWPFSVPQKLADLPLNMQDELSRYTDYYRAKHGGRVLNWDHELGTASLKARFKAGIKELSVSLYQAVVLLLFNDEEEIAFPDIAQRIRMSDEELRRTLQSLACGKKKVLKKIPPGRDVDDTDVFRFNADFQDPHARVHINTIQAKVSPEETRKTNESIEGDRKSFLDAAIVRIMKSKKELTYEQLKAATIDAVKNHFVPAVDLIKKRIDLLVDTEYLRRSEEDRNLFFYVA